MRTTAPRIGTSLDFRGTGAPPGGIGVALIGLVADPPLFINGCLLEVNIFSLAVWGGFMTPTEDWTWSASVPNSQSLIGQTLASQMVFVPPGGTRIETSNGCHLTFGR